MAARQYRLSAFYTPALTVSAVVLFLTVCYRLLDTPFWSYNGSRLMPSFAITHGVNYYVLLPGGPLYSSMYGPFGALVYLPATLLPSPNAAVLAGSAITVLLCFTSIAFLHWRPAGKPRSRADWLAFLACGLALGGIACGLLYSGNLRRWRAALPLSAACAVLSVFSKQMFLPVPAVLLLYVLAVRGRGPALSYFLWLAAAGLAAAGASVYAVGFGNIYHCLIWMPAHSTWASQSRLVGWITAARHFARVSMPVPVLLLACAAYLWLALPRPAEWRAVASSRCVPLLLVGIALLPFSFAGRAKTGGDINSFSFALFFLTCGLTVMLADVMRFAQDLSTRRLALAVLVACILPLVVSEAPLALDILPKLRQLPRTGQQVAFDYLVRHPGEAYFPWFPLSHYYADHQFRHYIWGLADHKLAGEEVSQATFDAYVPSNPRIIAFASDGTPTLYGLDVMHYLPAYTCPVADPDLPGWQVFARCR